MENKVKKEYENFQIFRLDGRNVFFEVLRSACAIGKVQINFIEYDPNQGNKQTKNIQTYMDIPKFLVFANDILSGKMAYMAKQAKEEKVRKKAKYCSEVFGDMGGMSARNVQGRIKQEKAKGKNAFNFEIPEGSALSRILYLTPGERQPWILSGQLGLGKENETGLIVPQGYPKEIVRVPMDDDGLKAFVLITQAHIQAYFTSLYKGGN